MELLPCPFCGSNDISIQYPLININNTEIKEVRCENCLVQHDINIWNTRHSPWILVKDRLPELNTEVLCFNGSKMFGSYTLSEIITDSLGQSSWHVYGIDEYDAGFGTVTHWMPLPTPPKETE